MAAASEPAATGDHRTAPSGVTEAAAAPVIKPAAPLRIRIFIDFWNFVLSVREFYSKDYPVDWRQLGPWLTKRTGETIGGVAVSYEEMLVYASVDPRSPKDRKLKQWATNILDRFPGVNVEVKDRIPRKPPECPTCYKPVDPCPACGASMAGTSEKGIDTAIATDMIRLAWEGAYDLAILVSADRDFVPVVEFLATRNVKVVHAGFKPYGRDLARTCWASFDIGAGIPART
jgi:uncharacterized LabA/DUF88 family protein